jgi:hypothetical protein
MINVVNTSDLNHSSKLEIEADIRQIDVTFRVYDIKKKLHS